MKVFTITENHLKLARRMYVGWQDCEFGAPEIDPKRPYGNSDVLDDIAEILDIEKDEDADWTPQMADYMNKLHREMQTVLQIALRTGAFEVGNYEGSEYGGAWKRMPR